MTLDRATGRVLRHDWVEERPTLVIEALGLREGEDVNFEMQVDVATGVVTAISRADLALVLRVEGLRIGNIESEWPPVASDATRSFRSADQADPA